MPSTYTPIATTTVGSNTSAVTFSSIPSTYTDLILVAYAISTSGTNDIGITFNGDTGSNYSRTFLGGNGSSAYSGRNSNVTVGYGMFFSTAGVQGTINIMNYANSTTNKTFLIRAGQAADSTAAAVDLWRSTSAINSVTLTAMAAQIATGSTFTLYGVKSA
jgi:hypothetical protein